MIDSDVTLVCTNFDHDGGSETAAAQQVAIGEDSIKVRIH
jgi:hypothetical protein